MSPTDSNTILETPPNLYATHESIPYGIAIQIRNCDEFGDDVIAEGSESNYRYTKTADEDALVVRPESWATSMRLGSMRMLAISLDAVPDDVLDEVNTDADVDLETYSLLVFGWPPTDPNHSIKEFSSVGVRE